MQNEPANFTVGQGCSLPRYTDVDAAHVVEVSKDGKKVAVTLDKATLLNGFKSGEPDALVSHPGGFCAHVEGVQRYNLEAQPDGPKIWFTLRKNGRWVQVGQPMNGTSQQLSPNHRHYHDYNF